MLLKDVKDPRIGRVTITRVTLSDDLRQARVAVALGGEADARARALEGLRSAAGFVRGELARRLNLRYAPRVVFEADESLDELQRLGRLFRGLERPREGEGEGAEGDA